MSERSELPIIAPASSRIGDSVTVRRDGRLHGIVANVMDCSDTFPTLAVIATQAGHDAGVLSAAGIPTAMVFVRNPTGVSHSPDEHAEMADCLSGVEALADVLAELAGA